MKKYVFVLSLLVTSMISLSLMAQSTNPVLNDSTNKNIIFTLPNGPSFEMVFVQGGTFTMGCTEDQKGKCEDDALPAHQVVLTDFYAGKYEVTQALWKEARAERLNIGLTTVISHRKNITEKLGIKSVAGLTIYAVMNGYIEADSI